MLDLNRLATEQRNERTAHIDEMETLDMLRLINSEDSKVAEAVGAELPRIADAVDGIAQRLRQGGRLLYVGAGTSGRLGVLDAVECPPTFSAPYEMVQGFLAGGMDAFFKAVEGAEDSEALGSEDMRRLPVTAKDALVGIAASGRTPYVLGAMKQAKKAGALVIGLCCMKGSPVDAMADIGIAPMPGPEVITGSTRLKSGTAQKMVLNMLSTGAMIRLGKVYGNLMVDVKPSNEKLVKRCVRIVCEATGALEEDAVKALEACDYRCKTAIVMIAANKSAEEAQALLEQAEGYVAKALTLAR